VQLHPTPNFLRNPVYWSDLKRLWVSLAPPVKIFLAAYFFILFLCVFWIPGNDFDTMSSYIARIKLEEFGDLHQTATLELQYLFPKFFDYLHKPFLEWGYFTTLPTFALFLATCLVLASVFTLKEKKVFLVFVMICPPILLALTSLKNDLALGCFAVLAWYCICVRRNSVSYMAVGILSLCALIGTKWHGFFVLPPLGAVFLYQLIRTHRPDARAFAVTALMLPLYWYVSSANVYLDNLVHFHRLTPRPIWLASQTPHIKDVAINLYRFIVSSILDSFDVPFFLIDEHTGWKIWPVLQAISAGGKQYSYAYIVNSEFSAFGISILFVLGVAVYSLCRSKDTPAVKCAAAAALFYTCAVLCFVPYSSWTNRYFLTGYLLALIPAVQIAARLKASKKIVILILAYAGLMSLQALLMDQERRLVPMTQSAPDGSRIPLSTIYGDLRDRDRLYFEVWSGYVHIYEELQKDVQLSDGLVFVNEAKDGDVPFLYPLIKDRSPANTRIINLRNSMTWDPQLCWDFPYVLVYKGTALNSG
jgi:hypothetical protein